MHVEVQFIIYCLLLLGVILTGFARYNKLTKPFRLLTWLVSITLLLEIIAKISAKEFRNNTAEQHLTSLTEYVFYASIYYALFRHKVIKMAILVTLVLFVVFFILNALWLQPFQRQFPSNTVLPSEIAYCVFSLLLFRQMLSYPDKVNIVKQGVFWFNFAMLLFSTTMFVYLGLINYYAAHHIRDTFVYEFFYIVNIIFYLMIAASLGLNSKDELPENQTGETQASL